MKRVWIVTIIVNSYWINCDGLLLDLCTFFAFTNFSFKVCTVSNSIAARLFVLGLNEHCELPLPTKKGN